MSFARNKTLKIITFAAVAASATVIIFYLIKGTAQDQKYRTFKSNDPAYDFTFEYPETWNADESRGRTDDYAMVQIIGPRDEVNEYSVGFSITVKTLENKNPNALLDEYTKNISSFQNFKIIKNDPISVANFKVGATTYEHAMRLPLRKLNAKDILMKGRAFVVVKNDQFYRFDFFGTAEQFKQHESVLKRIVKTFQFN